MSVIGRCQSRIIKDEGGCTGELPFPLRLADVDPISGLRIERTSYCIKVSNGGITSVLRNNFDAFYKCKLSPKGKQNITDLLH